jgi:quercetin dioxygenase-like cupin family protein
MKAIWILPAATMLAVGLTVPATGQAAEAIKTFQPDKMQWSAAPPMLPPGAKIAVLSGDPMAPGLFTIRLQTPAGYEVPAHHHPTAETVTVISGTFNFGHGDVLDRSRGEQLKPGAFVDIPANDNHFVWSGSDGAVVQITSMGPFAITYADPAKDPQHSTSAKK